MKSRILLLLTIIVILIGTGYRLYFVSLIKDGGDFGTHEQAIQQLFMGVNPYTSTLESYDNLDDEPYDKGYAYLPAIMYTNSIFYFVHLLLKLDYNIIINASVFFSLPGVIASVFIGVFFIKHFYKENDLAMLFCTIIWFANPLFIIKETSEGYDGVTVCLMLWALHFLEDDDVLSGSLYALAILFKTFPIILIFVFLLKAKNKLLFILSGLIMFTVFSLPFLKSVNDFVTYIRGALLVHGNRFVQGRPYLWYISWYGKIELVRIIPFKFYSLASIVSGWLVTPFTLMFISLKNKYTVSLFPFLLFYLLTPVLNRTYILWGLPIFLVGTYHLLNKKHAKVFYIINVAYWLFLYWYLVQWKDGFDIWHPIL